MLFWDGGLGLGACKSKSRALQLPLLSNHLRYILTPKAGFVGCLSELCKSAVLVKIMQPLMAKPDSRICGTRSTSGRMPVICKAR